MASQKICKSPGDYGLLESGGNVSTAYKTKRQRVIDHGEVFTPPELVNDMLDLVAQECEREDSRFLEPACGDGNFLAEVLRRRLTRIDQKYTPQSQWEAHALLGLACLYGIELLPDNTGICRQRLSGLFQDHYELRYGAKSKPAVIDAATHIVGCNIVQGDALAMTGPKGKPLILTEWALIGGGKFKRRLYAYEELTPVEDKGSLFASASEPVHNEEGTPVFIAQHVRDLPAVHYLNLATEGRES